MNLEFLLAPIRRRIDNLIARAVLRLVNDSKGLQYVQVETGALGELRGPLEHFQPFGFTSVAREGAEAIVLFPGGSRDHGLVIAVADRRYRLKGLASGAAALYTAEDNKVILNPDGHIQVIASEMVSVEAPSVEVVAGESAVVSAPTVAVEAATALTLSGGGSGIVVNAAGVAITAPLVAASGILQGATVQQGAGAYVLGDVAETTKAIYNAHTHGENGDGGGTTDPPNELIP